MLMILAIPFSIPFSMVVAHVAFIFLCGCIVLYVEQDVVERSAFVLQETIFFSILFIYIGYLSWMVISTRKTKTFAFVRPDGRFEVHFGSVQKLSDFRLKYKRTIEYAMSRRLMIDTISNFRTERAWKERYGNSIVRIERVNAVYTLVSWLYYIFSILTSKNVKWKERNRNPFLRVIIDTSTINIGDARH